MFLVKFMHGEDLANNLLYSLTLTALSATCPVKVVQEIGGEMPCHVLGNVYPWMKCQNSSLSKLKKIKGCNPYLDYFLPNKEVAPNKDNMDANGT